MNTDRPDHNETEEQRERYDAAQSDYAFQRDRIDNAANRFAYTVEQFHFIEQEFLALIDELRRTNANHMRNVAHLEGLRIRLLTSIDSDYRHAVNELADALLDSISPPPMDD